MQTRAPYLGYRIESSCSATGAYEHTQALGTMGEVHAHCTAEWRKASTHVVEILHGGMPPRITHVYVAGVCVSPRGYRPSQEPRQR